MPLVSPAPAEPLAPPERCITLGFFGICESCRRQARLVGAFQFADDVSFDLCDGCLPC